MSSHEPQDTPQATVCYKHPNKPSGVICQRCDRFICPACMHQASVGVHCPECTAKNKQKVYTRHNLPGTRGIATQVLIGLNVAVFVLGMVLWDATVGRSGSTPFEIAISGPQINGNGQWWRIFTGGFGHFDIIHLAMNMYGLYIFGSILERRLGPGRFALAYMTTLIGGSFGALLLSVLSLTMGASGAVFGLLGLTVMMYRSERINIAQSSLGPVLLLMLFVSFRGGVSLGGHAGGFLAGLVLGALYFGVDANTPPIFGRDQVKTDLATVAFAIALFVGSLAAASRWIQALG